MTIALPLASRIWRSFERDARSGCWNWTRAVTEGYGRMAVAGRKGVLAHRVVYELIIEPIPAGFELDHVCRNTRCVNPAHLEPVTHAENMRRAFPRRDQCSKGHEYALEQYVDPRGRRRCMECAREHRRKHYRRNREEVA